MSNLEECMTLWGEPEWVHLLNVEQLHANGHHQNVLNLRPQNITQKYTCAPHMTLWVGPVYHVSQIACSIQN